MIKNLVMYFKKLLLEPVEYNAGVGDDIETVNDVF